MLSISMLDAKVVSHLSLEALRTFVAVADLRSFTKAGQEVCRTQSAVSMQVKRLESDLGQRLLERNARAVALTPAGELLLGYARRLLKLHDRALASLTLPGVTGVVRLGVPDDYATRYLPDVLIRFARTNPMVRVDVLCDDSFRLVRLVKTGELDICLATSDGTSEDVGRGKVLARIPLVWAGAGDIDLEAIWRRGKDPLPLAVYNEGCLHRRWALQALDRAGIPHRIAFGGLSLAAIMAAVRTGLAVTPAILGSLDAQCRILPPESGLPALPEVSVVLHEKGEGQNQAAACLARFLEERFQVSNLSFQYRPLPA